MLWNTDIAMTVNVGIQNLMIAQMYKKIEIIEISSNNNAAFFVYISIIN